jgi:hypothetical protein
MTSEKLDFKISFLKKNPQVSRKGWGLLAIHCCHFFPAELGLLGLRTPVVC